MPFTTELTINFLSRTLLPADFSAQGLCHPVYRVVLQAGFAVVSYVKIQLSWYDHLLIVAPR